MLSIKSPINYTGNKFRILPQIQPYFPQDIETMVDLFCGGATVGVNTKCNKIIFIDNDSHVVGLLKFLANSDYEQFVSDMAELIESYNLSFSAKYGYAHYKSQLCDTNKNNGLKQYNSDGYYKLRADYNSLPNKNNKKAYELLYLLMVYAFNNDMRFSRSGDFNLPVGKTDLNDNNLNKVKAYIERVTTLNAQFICGDFRHQRIQNIIKNADFVYMDPPYLITNAVYNESGKWTEQHEYELIRFMNYCLDNDKFFVLSNILERHGRRNEPLYYWTTTIKDKIEIVDIDYNYRSASYNKKERYVNEREVIIFPKRHNA